MSVLSIALAITAAGAAGGAATPGKTIDDCAACGTLMVIPAGTFLMGGPAGEAGRPEYPQRKVRIPRSFAVGKTEVTNRQYAAFVAATGHVSATTCRTWDGNTWITSSTNNWKRPSDGAAPTSDAPVVCVSWKDASAFAAWLERLTGQPYRLLSEAEWEYAARAGSSAETAWGNDETTVCAIANVYDVRSAAAYTFSWKPADCDDGHVAAAPAASYPANGFGLHDIIGNVWEWTQDCYVAPYPAGPLDGTSIEPAAGEQCARRTVRGGSWMTRLDRHRFSFRGRDPETAAFLYFGFRISRDIGIKAP